MHVNRINEASQFTVENETANDELPFLDCLIQRNSDSSLNTTVYKKPTNTVRYLNFHFCHSSATKQGFIKCLFLRANILCSTCLACNSVPNNWQICVNKGLTYLLTARLLTHVPCKPTHFFFHSFIATISYSLQTSFSSVMKDWADKYHVWGTPTRSPSRSNLR